MTTKEENKKTVRVPGYFSYDDKIVWKEVEILYENNGWAVTPTTSSHGPDEYPYTITHIQTGCGACKLEDKDVAIELCNKLQPTEAFFVEEKGMVTGSALQIEEAVEVIMPYMIDGFARRIQLPSHLENKVRYSWEATNDH